MDKRPPVQSKKDNFNIIGFFLMEKPITTFGFLRLNWRISSWHYAAKLLCKVYARCLYSNAMPPRCVPLFSRCAKLLLFYAEEAWGITKPKIHQLDGGLSWEANSLWLVELLKKIKLADTIEKLYNCDRVSFQVKEGIRNQKGKCAITHKEVNDRFIYETVCFINDAKGGEIISKTLLSKPIGSNVIQRLRINLQKALNRHRSKKAQEKIISDARDKRERNSKLAVHRDRLFTA